MGERLEVDTRLTPDGVGDLRVPDGANGSFSESPVTQPTDPASAPARAEPLPVDDQTDDPTHCGSVNFDLDGIVGQLRAVRQRWRGSQHRSLDTGGRELPSLEALASIVEGLRGALFPMRLGPADLRQEREDYYVGHVLGSVLNTLFTQACLELRGDPQGALRRVRGFGAALPEIRSLLDSDVLAAFHGDPAARSVDEVLLCYPGIQAMIHHRIAHELYRQGLPLLARLVAEQAHAATGIDIHPGATIGAGFFIDHGTGVVIGETARIGRNVRLYQQVTLGAKRFAADADGHLHKGGDRHPIVEDDVVVYAGATILGRVTIGQGSTVGGNVWLTHSVPPGSHIAQAQSRETRRDESAEDDPAC